MSRLGERQRRDGLAGLDHALTQAIVDAALDGVVMMNERGVVREFNAAAERLFGWRRADAVGHLLAELIVPPHHRAAHQAGLARLLATGRSRIIGRRIETEAMHADGGIIPIELAITEVRLRGERVFIAYLRDITERREAIEALRRNEQRLRAIVEDQSEFISRFTPDGTITYVNQAYAAQLGRSVDEIIGTSLLALMDEAQAARFTAQLANLTPERRAVSYEMDTVLTDGSMCFEHWTDRAIFDAGGQVLEYQSVGRDVTEQRRAEAALLESERLFRAIVEDQTEFIIRFDRDRRVTFVNRAFAAQLGRDARGLIGTPVLDHVEERNRGWFTAQLDALTPEAPTVSYETENRLPDGDQAWEHWTDRALFNEAGRLVGYQSVGRDVTKAKRVEAELRQSEQRFRGVVEDQTELICRFDASFRLTFSNVAHARLYGCTPEALLGQQLFDHVPEEVREPLRAALLARTPEDPVVHMENEKHLPSGEVRWYDWTNRALFDAMGRVTGYQAVGRDITERREQQAEILRQRETLHQQEKLTALGSLLAGVAHELNNPLAVVVGRALMLEEEITDPAQAAAVGKLHAAAERCSRIVKTFLGMARQRQRERRRTTLDQVLDAALDITAYGLRTAGIEVRRIPSPPSQPVVVMADEDQLHQLVMNLVVNAQHALRDVPSPRFLAIDVREVEGWAQIEIADNGPGIPPAIRRRIFDPFFTTKPQGVGTGIGLSVSHAIIEAHGGTITIEDRPGGGALFRVRLPAAVDAPAAASVTEAVATPEPLPARILVVDDEPEVLAMVGEILRRDGHRVELAGGGDEALRHLEAAPFDLVVSDLWMPDSDGRELHRVLRDHYPALAAQMVVLTGDTLGSTPADLPGIDREAMLEKPLTPASLREAVRHRLAQARLKPSVA